MKCGKSGIEKFISKLSLSNKRLLINTHYVKYSEDLIIISITFKETRRGFNLLLF